MSDTSENSSVNPAEDPNGQAAALDPNIRQALQQTGNLARERDAALAEAQSAQRELAFVRAGVPTDAGVGKLLVQTYQGDLTPEAIRTYMDAEGLSGVVTPVATGQAAPPGELQAYQRIAQAGTAVPPAPPERLEDAIAKAKSFEEVVAICKQAPEELFRVPKPIGG